MRVVMMGTSEFAVPTLEKLASERIVAAVVTQPNRPSGRGRKPTPPPVQRAAETLGVPIHQPEKVRSPEFLETLHELRPDVIAVVSYGQLLPKAALEIPLHGCVNLHPSLLPKYRGAAPIQRAIWNGETETGVTIMLLDEGEDTGPILRQHPVPIRPDETAAQLHDRLAALGAEMMADALRSFLADPPTPVRQNDALATKAPKLERADGQADWNLPARTVYNRFRACVPWPGTYTHLPDGSRARILDCRPTEQTANAAPGSIFAERGRLFVQTASGQLEITRIQPENRAAMSAADFLNGLRGNIPAAFVRRDLDDEG